MLYRPLASGVYIFAKMAPISSDLTAHGDPDLQAIIEAWPMRAFSVTFGVTLYP